jgi:hypothetical protein
VTPTIGANTPHGGSVEGHGEQNKDHNEKVGANEANMKVNPENPVDLEEDIKLSITDVNPILPIWHILKQRTNVCILSASGKYIINLLYWIY